MIPPAQAALLAFLTVLVTVLLRRVWSARSTRWRAERLSREEQWVRDAEAAVDRFFRDGAAVVPAGPVPWQSAAEWRASWLASPVPGSLGMIAYQGLFGSGHTLPFWNLQGYHYLTAPRTARFSNGSLPVTLYVGEGRVRNPGGSTLVVQYVQGGPPSQGLFLHVAHPDVVP